MPSTPGAPIPLAAAISPRFELSPVEPAQLPVPVVANLPVPVPLRSAVISRETVTQGLLSLASVSGVGVLAYVGGSTVTLVAAALTAAVATGIGVARFLGAGGPAQREAVAALTEERKSLAATRELLQSQLSAIAFDREQVASTQGNLQADRAALTAERALESQRIDEAAHRLIAPAKEALATQQAQLDAQRATLAAEQSAFEARRGPDLTSLENEARTLSDAQIASLTRLIESYYTSNTTVYYRFAGQTYAGQGVTNATHHCLWAAQVLNTLVSQGQVVAGVAKQAAADNAWMIPTEGATTITTVAQLREYLRLATGTSI